jgi:glucan 1,3-beta-glucosidase
MRSHLSSWITETDLQAIQAYGFNSLRVPIGYWNILSDPYHRYAPQDPEISHFYLNWLFQMAEKYDLTILLDLHGAPGSQNGMDHSGCSMSSPTSPGAQWIDENHPAIQSKNWKLTYETLEILLQRYGNHPKLIGIELLNEPLQNYEENFHDDLLLFYQTSYSLIRHHPSSSSSLLILYNELYQDFYSSWKEEFIEPKYFNVVMDWHLYHWQDYYAEEHSEKVLEDVIGWEKLINNFSRWDDNPVVIGEWSMSSGNGKQGKALSLELGQRFVSEMVGSFARSWAVGWYVWNWKIDQSTTVTVSSTGGGGGGEAWGEYDPWNVQYQSTLPDGLRVPFVPPGGGELFIHPSASPPPGAAAEEGKGREDEVR